MRNEEEVMSKRSHKKKDPHVHVDKYAALAAVSQQARLKADERFAAQQAKDLAADTTSSTDLSDAKEAM